MTGPEGRRGFLRGLVTLPLIGGGVTLVGKPTAVAAPVTPALMDRYVAWLAREHAEALVERDEVHHPGALHVAEWRREWVHQPLFWFPEDPVAHASVLGAKPSTRAAVVLSAAGCEWRAT